MTHRQTFKTLLLTALAAALTALAPLRLHAEEIRICSVHCDTSVSDYTPVIRQLLNSHPEGRVKLVFGKGTYHFYPDGAEERYLCVSNNDNGLKRIAFDIDGMKEVEIDGGGSDFIFHGRIVPFAVESSENVTLKNLSVDYAEPFLFEAEVIASDQEKRQVTVKVHPDCRYEVKGGQVYFGGYGWSSGLGVNILFDKASRRPYFHTDRYYHHTWKHPMTAQVIGKDTLVLSDLNSTELPPVGSIITDKGYLNRLVPGIAIRDSRQIAISDVNVYHSGAMALIAEYSEDLTLTRYNVVTREGSGRMISSTADASHFTDCRGKILLEDCRFESMLDDATNVHGTHMKVERLQSDSMVIASFGHGQQQGNLFAKAGDRIRFIDRKSLRPVATARVRGIDRVNSNWYEIRIEEMTETGTSDKTGSLSSMELALENLSRVADVCIRNCTVEYNRARSFLISTPGDVVIEDCRLSSMMAGIRISGDANFWFESGNTRNVMIRRNRFEDLGINGDFPQAILQIDPVIPKDARTTDFFYHDRIVFEDNTVCTFDTQIIYACSVKELIIRGNRFIDSGSHEPIYPGLSAIDAQFCGQVTVTENDFGKWRPGATISLHRCLRTRISECPLEKTDHPNPFFFEN